MDEHHRTPAEPRDGARVAAPTAAVDPCPEATPVPTDPYAIRLSLVDVDELAGLAVRFRGRQMVEITVLGDDVPYLGVIVHPDRRVVIHGRPPIGWTVPAR